MSPSRQANNRSSQRGATLVSVMLLAVTLITLALLLVRSSARELTEAGQLVARERARTTAETALGLAAAQLITRDGPQIDAALMGTHPQGPSCDDPCGDCIPGDDGIVTGQRNDALAGATVSCGGRPCMRQGAVASLRDASGTTSPWCDRPVRDLLDSGDPEARVSVWIRNNSADVLGPAAGQWTRDHDGRVVLTARATVRGVAVTLERELSLSPPSTPQAMLPQSADEGHGGGHNNDNTAVSVCRDDYLRATGDPAT